MIGLTTVTEGQRVIIWNVRGETRRVDGPKRMFLFRERVQPLLRHMAEPDQYLIIKHIDGKTEHIVGPAMVWFDPLVHKTIAVEPSTKIDANEALVVYRRQDEKVSRRVVRGPALFVPGPDEWIHQFRWHGADPNDHRRKIPRALQFEKLRVIPDQMYFDVKSVRTNDDALVVVKLMVFFELVDIERMLDQTHDPIADFINAMGADVVDYVGSHDFDQFKGATDALNDLKTYPQLTQRAKGIGYKINKVVYRGYYASEKLQAMHDNAIECRTGLRLEAETERQAQELADMKLAREQQRAERQREMDEANKTHDIRMQELETAKEREGRRLEGEMNTQLRKSELQLKLDHEKAMHNEQAGHFNRLKELQVDLTRYLVAQYQNPDKIIRIDGQQQPQMHLHEN